MLLEKLASKDGESRIQKFKNKVFKDQPLMKDVIEKRRKLHKKNNKAKFAKIQIKSQKSY